MKYDIETLKQALEIAKLLGAGESRAADAPETVNGDGRAVIVRSKDAGVQFGYLDRYEGSTVYLTKARQLRRPKNTERHSLTLNRSVRCESG